MGIPGRYLEDTRSLTIVACWNEMFRRSVEAGVPMRTNTPSPLPSRSVAVSCPVWARPLEGTVVRLVLDLQQIQRSETARANV